MQHIIRALYVDYDIMDILKAEGYYQPAGGPARKTFTGKASSPKNANVHMDPKYLGFVTKAISLLVPQKAINPMLIAAGLVFETDVIESSLPNVTSIGRVMVAAGAIAMAFTCSSLVKDGLLNQSWSLMTDGGSMNNSKWQAVVASKPTGNSEKPWSDQLLGSIPLARGTEEARVGRIFELFEDLIASMKALPYFGVSKEDAADASLAEMLAGTDSFAGDHGCVQLYCDKINIRFSCGKWLPISLAPHTGN
jgi:hypothetical protein